MATRVWSSVWVSVLATFPVCACAPLGGLAVDVRAVAAEAPANVAVYLDVARGEEPVALTADNVTLYEDDQALSPELTQQRLLDKAGVVQHHTVLLVDNSLATDLEVRSELANAISIFVEEASRTQPVSVFAYDGSERLSLLAEFPRVMAPKPVAPGALRLVPKDLSRNLNGAMLLGARELGAKLSRSAKPLGVGTLVLFAAGADLAGRTNSDVVYEWLGQTPYTVITIGYGDQSDSVRSFGKDAYYDAVAKTTLSLAFEEAAHRVTRQFARGHLLSYCSPARSGMRALRVEVSHAGEAGDDTGTASTEFKSDGFRAGCDAKRPARFKAPPAEPQ